MFIFHLLILILGLAALIAGAKLLVKKAAFFSKKFHINPFFVGVVLLGMGTSAPEWAVSTISSIKGLSNLAVANVFGSNIFNILLVLGIILLLPLSKTNIQVIKKDMLFLIFSSVALIPIMLDYFISSLDAFFLTLIFLAYIALSLFSAKMNHQKKQEIPESTKNQPVLKEVLFIILGLSILIGGSHLTVTGAAHLSQQLGMSERLIGILIVSVGTGLPELFASLTAIMKNHRSMAIGNIIGSNIFNTFAILSTSAWIQPVAIDPQILTLDLPVLLVVHTTLLLIIFCYQIRWIQKALPYVFFSGYIAYIIYLLSI